MEPTSSPLLTADAYPASTHILTTTTTTTTTVHFERLYGITSSLPATTSKDVRIRVSVASLNDVT